MNVLPSLLNYGEPCASEPTGSENVTFVAEPLMHTPASCAPSIICNTNPCPVILNATCVFYEGSNLVYTGINTNDNLQTALQKIDSAISQFQSFEGNYVVTSTTLTINGVTYDLSASRTWSVGTVTSVGITMPPAFSVTNSPITTSGTLTVTGAGLVSQYVRGDGTLADFPGGGGGSSVKYYFNGGTNQGTFGGNTYYEMSKTAVIGTNADFSTAIDGYISQFITDPNDPALINIPGGSWDFQMYFSASSSGGSPSFYIELYKYDGTTFTLIGSSSTTPEFITGGTSIDLYYTSVAVPATPLTPTDRLAVRFYVSCSGRTITLHTQDTHLCSVTTTFSTGITAINSLTDQVQYLTTGTAGTDFNILSAAATHTFNLPIASAVNTGKLSAADWTTFNNKPSGSGVAGQVTFWTGASTQSGSSNLTWDNVNNRLTIGAGGFSGDFEINKQSAILTSYRNNNNGVNLTNGASVYQWDMLGQRNGAASTLARMQLIYNGDGITRRGKLMFAVAESSGFGGQNLILTQSPTNNAKIVIAGQNSFAYSDSDVALSTTYGLHGNLIAASTSSGGVNNPLSIDRDGIVQSVFFNSGNFSIGSIVDSGQRLQVTGTALFTGSVTGTGSSLTYSTTASGGIARSSSIAPTLIATANNDVLAALDISPTFTTGAFTGLSTLGLRVNLSNTVLQGNTNDSSAFALTVLSSGATLLRVRNDQKLLIGGASTSAAPVIYAFTGITGDRSLRIGIQSAGSLTPIPAFNINQENDYTYTTGTGEFTTITANFLPTSGNGTLAYLTLKGTINQVGATGVTRGLYINPTLTLAPDWRAIEVAAGITILAPSTTTSASLRLPNGVAPTTPTNGDIWSTTTDLLARINGTTYSLINSGLSGSGAAGQVTFWSSATNITGSNNLFWDSATSRLGINTNTPVQALDVRGIVSINTNGQATTISTYRLAGTDGNNIWIGGGGTASTGTTSQGSYNTGVGVNALSANTTGSFNNAIGFGALTSNTTGNNNNSIGWNALSFNTTGTSNVAFGHFALRTNGTGSSNVAVGESALRLMTTGNNNVAVGASAMYSANGAQTSNVAVGAVSLYNNGGNQNTAIGMESGMGAAPYTNGNTSGGNNIFIGFQSVGESATASNRTFIGNTSTTSTWLGGNLLLGTRTDAGQRLQVSGNTVLTNPPSYQLRLSDGTFKWDLWAVANVTNTDLRFVDNSGNNVMILYNGGNVSIGNNSNNARLSVSGDTRLGGNLTLINTGTTTFTYSGAGSFSHDAVGTGGQLVYNPASGIRYKFAGGTSGFIFGATSNTQTTGTTILISSSNLPNNNVFQSSITPNFTGGGDFATIVLSGTVSLDALNNLSGGIQTGIKVAETFSPNTANKDIRYIGVSIQPSINQTAGLTQITRGLYINPSITAAADWRAIETSAGGAYINTTAVNASAILQADSTTKGFLPPRMTVAQRTAIVSPAEGLIVFQTDGTIGLYVYANATWRSLTMV